MTRIVTAVALVVVAAGAAPSPAHAQGSEPSGNLDFATAVAANQGVAFAGEPDHLHTPGIVYAFVREDGDWVEGARLQAGDGEVGDFFGSAVAADAGRLVVGAPGAGSHGAVYVFEGSGADWNEVARLTAPGDDPQGFAEVVAVAGDRVFASENVGDDEGVGTVHVFERNGDDWTVTASLSAEALEGGERFGAALAADGDRLVVAAPQSGDGGELIPFRHVGDGWEEGEALAPGGLDEDALLGMSVLARDGRLLAGAPRQGGGVGAVFLFREEGEGWSADGRLAPYDGTPQHAFGVSVAFDGEAAWVGAPGAAGTGALYRHAYDEDAEAWTSATRLVPSEAEDGGGLGATLAVREGTAVAGLPGAQYGAGQAAIYQVTDEDALSAGTLVEGAPDAALTAITGQERPCEDGEIERFGCENVDLLSFLPIHEIGGERGVGTNDVWGWTDPETGREIALVGRTNGLSFVDVTDPVNPVYLGELPKTDGARASSWRDAKVYRNHAFVVSDNAGPHGMQVFDLTRLRDQYDGGEPATFEPDAVYGRVGSVHNVELNTESGYAYLVGTSGGEETCGGGLHMVDLSDPLNPEFRGCFADEETGRAGTGYTHDAQCVIYNGPDERYQGREICFGSNETALSIADVTEKDDPRALSRGTYPNFGYVHQAWLSEDHEYLYMNDELDELNELVDNTRTLIWDVRDLEDPQLAEEFFHETTASTHNLYIVGDLQFQSNYKAGLQILDISEREAPRPVGHFDTAPSQEGPGFAGSWSNYPFFESGTVLVNSMNEGIFLVRPQDGRLLP